MTAAGTKVFALRDADDDEVRIYGHGTYIGDRRRPASDTEVAEMRALAADAIADHDRHPPIDVDALYANLVADGTLTEAEAETEKAAARERIAATRARPFDERVDELVERLLSNPCIELDDGGTVWGFQCWWAPETRFDDAVAGRRVVTVALPT